MKSPIQSNRGMTLIELVIVLGLLAALSTMALSALDGLGNRDRVETTRARLEQIRKAVAGEDSDAGRFLSDMGRLPVVKTADEGKELSELWENVEPVIEADSSYAFDFHELMPDVFSEGEITVEPWFGWRGPYMIASSDALYDGFGRAFKIYTGSGDVIQTVSSLGRDGVAGGSEGWADEDVDIVFSDFMTSVSLRVMAKIRDNSGEQPVWRTGSPLKTPPPFWRENRFYSRGDLIMTTGTAQCIFECHQSGQSGIGASISWNTLEGEITSDGLVQWMSLGDLTDIDRNLFAALLVPDVTKSNLKIGCKLVGGNNWESSGGLLIDDVDGDYDEDQWKVLQSGSYVQRLTPGFRKLFVLGCLENVKSTPAATGLIWVSGIDPETIELKPGANHVVVYLTVRN